jgi:hypothetical protein
MILSKSYQITRDKNGRRIIVFPLPEEENRAIDLFRDEHAVRSTFWSKELEQAINEWKESNPEELMNFDFGEICFEEGWNAAMKAMGK